MLPKPVKDMERKLKWQAALMSTVTKAHRGGSLSQTPAPRTDPAQRGIRKWALWPLYLGLTITVSSFTGYKAPLCFPSDPQQDEYQHLYFGVSIPPLHR